MILPQPPMQSTPGAFDASVIIPTHNRRTLITRLVAALTRQTHLAHRFEIVVVCDRCTDGTVEALRSAFGEAVHVHESTTPGIAGALTLGAGVARGDVLIFLDDETEPSPGMVGAYVAFFAAHGGDSVAAVGYSPVQDRPDMTAYDRAVAEEYAEFYRDLTAPGHVMSPLDLAGFNFALRANSLRDVGGFSPHHDQRDDFELATRLMEHGYTFHFCREARADQWVAITASRLMTRAGLRAAEDVRLAREHPWCVRFLPFYADASARALASKRRAAWTLGPLAAAVVSGVRRFNPSAVALIHWEYRLRYFAGLRRAGLSWTALRRMCVAAETAPIAPASTAPRAPALART